MEQATSGLTALFALLSIPVLIALSLRPAEITDVWNPPKSRKDTDNTAA